MTAPRLVLVAAMLFTAAGCAQRYAVPSRDLMRGQVVEDVYVRTADGYEYYVNRGAVEGDDFVGTVVEEVESIGEDGGVFIANEVREIRLPISSIVAVQGEKRYVSPNALYVAGALGVGVIIFATITSVDENDVASRGSGPAVKPPPHP